MFHVGLGQPYGAEVLAEFNGSATQKGIPCGLKVNLKDSNSHRKPEAAGGDWQGRSSSLASVPERSAAKDTLLPDAWQQLRLEVRQALERGNEEQMKRACQKLIDSPAGRTCCL